MEGTTVKTRILRAFETAINTERITNRLKVKQVFMNYNAGFAQIELEDGRLFTFTVRESGDPRHFNFTSNAEEPGAV